MLLATDGASASVDHLFPVRQFPAGFGPKAIAICDLDGDGDLDAATANVHGVSILRGQNDGTFLPPADHYVEGELAWICAGVMGVAAAKLSTVPLIYLDSGEVAFAALGSSRHL